MKSIEKKISSAPTCCGVYLFRDSRNRIIYIGKAKNLRTRLRSYTGAASGLDVRKREMLKTVHDLSFIITDNELEALALEANLIKQNRPKYNIILRDDKNYPYIRIDLNQYWPRIEVVRRIGRDNSLYFGPYIPASGLRETLSLIRRHFNIRPCRYSTLEHVKPCVQYQMGRCPAPCGRLISRETYMKSVDEVIDFLKGKGRALLDTLRKQMQGYSKKEMFEDAAKTRDRIAAIEKIWDSQRVVAPGLGEIDVVGLAGKGNDTAIVQLFIRDGLMTGSKEFFLKDTSDLSESDLLHSFIEMLYSNRIIPPRLLLTPSMPADSGTIADWLTGKKGRCVKIAAPQKGQKKQLIEMACKNAQVFLEQHRAVDYEFAVAGIRNMIGLSAIPQSIGAFDVSTIQGTGSVGAFVLWENGHFRKSSYRFVNIRTVDGVDDYSMMEESVERIISNMTEHVPDLIIIDGGRGQLQIAGRILKKIALSYYPEIIAIAKDPDRVLTAGGAEISIDDTRPASLLLRKIRDEVHRFAITRHRKARTGRMLSSSLEKVPGVGKKRRLALLRHFGSLEAIKKAPVEDISNIKGFNMKLAKNIKNNLPV